MGDNLKVVDFVAEVSFFSLGDEAELTLASRPEEWNRVSASSSVYGNFKWVTFREEPNLVNLVELSIQNQQN